MTMENQGNSDIYRLIEIAWRRKWAILVPFLAVFICVSLWGLYLPNIYRSTTSIFVEPQKVPSEYVRSTVTTDLQDRLRTVTQQMTSRTNLLKVIEELDLYPELMMAKVPSEVLVARMRKDLTIEAPSGRRGPSDFFQVSYVHHEPNKAMLAVSKLVSLFIDESLRIREQQAEGTTIFIEEELEKLRNVLEEQEKVIQEYKGAHLGELPGQLETNLRMLDNLQVQLSSNLESQRQIEDRLMLIEREISRLEEEKKAAETLIDEGGSGTGTTLSNLLLRREELRRQVTALESRYTDLHPDLIAARKELFRVEEKLQVIYANQDSAGDEGAAREKVKSDTGDSRELRALRRQYQEVEQKLAALRRVENDLKTRIVEYQQRVEVVPNRQQRLYQLTRDYENTKASYQDLLSKKLEATLSENLERRQQGENFQILDPPNYPEEPYLPNRKKIIAMGLAGGMGSGFGLAFLLEILFPAFYSLKQLKGRDQYPIVLGIPYISSSRERWNRGIKSLVGAALTVTVIAVGLFLFDRYVVALEQFVSTIGINLKGMM